MTDQHKQFKQVLDDHHQWPCPYLFKFIIPADKLEQFKELFPNEAIDTRTSKTGKYISVTLESNMCSSHEVMAVYNKASEIPGIMSL